MRKNSKKGFTLAELLVVVAIIAVLVAVAIPVLTDDLERSRDATSVANLRSAYADAMVEMLNEDTSDVVIHGVHLYGNTAGLEEGLTDNLPFTLDEDGKWIEEGIYNIEFIAGADDNVWCGYVD